MLRLIFYVTMMVETKRFERNVLNDVNDKRLRSVKPVCVRCQDVYNVSQKLKDWFYQNVHKIRATLIFFAQK